MSVIQTKINKLLLGFQYARGRIIKISQEQFYSEKMGKVFTKLIVDEYHPEKKELQSRINFLRKTNKGHMNDIEIEELHEEIMSRWKITNLEYYKKLDILLMLIEEWREGEEGMSG